MKNETFSGIRAAFSNAKEIVKRHHGDFFFAFMLGATSVGCLTLTFSPGNQFVLPMGKAMLAVAGTLISGAVGWGLTDVFRPDPAAKLSNPAVNL